MSERVLSQEELDALMSGMATGADELSPVKAGEPLAQSGLPAFEIAGERFCKFFARSLFTFLRKSVEVTPGGTVSMKCSDFLDSKDKGVSFNIFEMAPEVSFALAALDTELVFKLLSASFGGAANLPIEVEGEAKTEAGAREFTLFEHLFIKRIAQMVLTEFECAFRPPKSLDLKYKRLETNPAHIDESLKSETVLVFTFQIEMEGLKSPLSISVPDSFVELLG
jgi:flagellar motor switch protein FliM